MEKITSTQFASSAIWRFIDVISRKIVSLFVSILLARMIAPEAYGVVALTMVFIVFSDIFILNGFNVALIRKEKTSPIDYSTVMTMSLVFTMVMYSIIWVLSPFFADFYESPDLCPVLRTITLLLFFESISSVIRAKATREVQFKKMTIAGFASNLISGLMALSLAYFGYGVWALVVQQITANFFEMLILLIVFRWTLSFRFSRNVAKELSKFTMGVLGTSFLDFLGNNVSNLVVGKSYSTRDLGYVNRANIFPETIGLNAYNSINSVLLPTLSSRQDSNKDMKIVLRKVMSLTLYVVAPLMFGLMGTANVLIPVLLSDKWIASIPLMYFCCLYYAINPIRAIGYSAFYAKGQSKHSVDVEVVRSILLIVGVVFVAVVFKLSLIAVMATNLCISLIVAAITHYKVRELLNYGYRELLQDIFPALIMSTIMAFCIFFISKIHLNAVILLIIQIITGALIYWFLSYITHNRNYNVVKQYILEKISQKNDTCTNNI